MCRSGRRLLVLVVLLAGFASLAGATPIQPDLKQLIEQAERPLLPYVPARAGWYETKTAKLNDLSEFEIDQILDEAATERAMRATLAEFVVPEPRVYLCLIVVMFLLRSLRARWRKSPTPQSGEPLERAEAYDLPKAA
jgi:hypothetical protein